MLPDGRVFINGGNLQYDPFYGEPRNAAFDPATGTFSDLPNMADGRWYPTVTTLGDGSVMTFSGLRDTGGTNTTVEIYTPGAGWSPPVRGGLDAAALPAHASEHGRKGLLLGLRPRLAVLQSRDDDVDVGRRHDELRQLAHLRHVRAAPAQAGRRLSAAGDDLRRRQPGDGDDGDHRSVGAPTPSWQFGPPMSQPRIEMNATILPNGRVLAMGGSVNDEDAATSAA